MDKKKEIDARAVFLSNLVVFLSKLTREDLEQDSVESIVNNYFFDQKMKALKETLEQQNEVHE